MAGSGRRRSRRPNLKCSSGEPCRRDARRLESAASDSEVLWAPSVPSAVRRSNRGQKSVSATPLLAFLAASGIQTTGSMLVCTAPEPRFHKSEHVAVDQPIGKPQGSFFI